MFGFMLDETDTPDRAMQMVACGSCYIRLAPRAPRVVDGQTSYHRDCFEAVHRKRTGKRPTLVSTGQSDRFSFRLAA
jgi:hypothetical protein